MEAHDDDLSLFSFPLPLNKSVVAAIFADEIRLKLVYRVVEVGFLESSIFMKRECFLIRLRCPPHIKEYFSLKFFLKFNERAPLKAIFIDGFSC